MVAMRFPWKRCGWYLAFVGGASPTLPSDCVESCRRNQPTIFQVWGRHSWRESANEGPFHAATSSKLEPCCLMGALWIRCAERYATESGRVGGISTPATGVALQDRVRKSNKQSIPETAWLATYSSLRRKKIQRQPGESSSLRPSGQWPTLECGAKHFRWLLETRFNRACVFACVLTWLLFKSNTTSQKREEKA